MKSAVTIVICVASILFTSFVHNGCQRQENANTSRTAQDRATSPSAKSTKALSVTDFEIISFTPGWEDGRLRAIGEIRNNGTMPGGTQVEVIARDASGTLIDSKQFWPNSINNIPPGGTCGIAFTITQNKNAKTAQIKVISVKTWE